MNLSKYLSKGVQWYCRIPIMMFNIVGHYYRVMSQPMQAEGRTLFHWVARHRHYVMWSQAQYGEDRIILKAFRFRPGFIVEVGSNNGISNSNSYLLERLGWNGILIEPDPRMAKISRKARRFPTVERAVVGPESPVSATFFVCAAESQWSTLGTDPHHNDAILRHFSPNALTSITVRAATLDSVLEENNAPSPIDVITVDVEGNEADVLAGFSIDRWHPQIVILERNMESADPAVTSYMNKNGYVRCFTSPDGMTTGNDWYVPTATMYGRGPIKVPGATQDMNRRTAIGRLSVLAVVFALIAIKGQGKGIGWHFNIPLMAYRKLIYGVRRTIAGYGLIGSTCARIYGAFLRARVRMLIKDRFWANELIKHELFIPDFRMDSATDKLLMKSLGLSLSKGQAHLLNQYRAVSERKAVVERLFPTIYEKDADAQIIASVNGMRVRVDTVEGYGLIWEMLQERPYDYDLGTDFVVWDIGLNAGVASLFFASLANVKLVFGFEPFPKTYEAAKYNLSLNPGLSNKIRTFNYAIGGHDRTVTAIDNQDLRGGNSLRWSNRHSPSDAEVSLEVRDACIVLEMIAREAPGLPIVCKLDAEGAEYEIIPSLVSCGRITQIKAFMMEYHKEGPDAITSLLRPAGFRVNALPHYEGSENGYIYAAQEGYPMPSPERQTVKLARTKVNG